MVRCRVDSKSYLCDFAASLQNDSRQSILISEKKFDRLERSCGTYADKRNCAEGIL
jgi:hypothetical protein